MIALIKNYRYSHPEVYSYDPKNEEVPIHLDDLMIVFLLQHIIFIVCRPILAIPYFLFGFLMDMGEPYPEGDPLDFSIISFRYIDYLKKNLRDNDEAPEQNTEYDMI